jgi:hypothetical protein
VAFGYSQIEPKPLLNAVAGAVLGLLLGIGLRLSRTWMEADSLRTPAAVERSLGCRCSARFACVRADVGRAAVGRAAVGRATAAKRV